MIAAFIIGFCAGVVACCIAAAGLFVWLYIAAARS